MIDQLCFVNDCELIILIPSYSKSWYREYLNIGYHDLLIKKLNENLVYAKKHFLSCEVPDSVFYDGVHVNEAGKQMKSQQIIELVSSSFKCTKNSYN